jgi:hypothetical protein
MRLLVGGKGDGERDPGGHADEFRMSRRLVQRPPYASSDWQLEMENEILKRAPRSGRRGCVRGTLRPWVS